MVHHNLKDIPLYVDRVLSRYMPFDSTNGKDTIQVLI